MRLPARIEAHDHACAQNVIFAVSVRLLSLVLPAIQDDLHGFRAGENRKPFHNRAGHEMGFVWFGDDIAAAAHVIPFFVSERYHSHALTWECF